jgi:squalene-associated FAD-dependent desaturase
VSGRLGVVGGGLAGIAAALTAADGGAEVVLLERRPTLGGLTSSIQRNGLSFDNGQHVFLRCCTEYRELLGRMGATSQVLLQRRLDVPVLRPGGASASIGRSRLPAPFHLAGALARYRHLSLRERAGLLGAALALRRLDPDDALLDAIAFGPWLAEHGQSERAIERLWNLIALPTLNVPAGEASLKLATKVFRVGLLDRADAGDIGWSAVPLGELHGANAAQALGAAGVEVALSSPVGSVERSAGGGFVVTTGTRKLAVDTVIVATPPRSAVALGAFEDGRAAEALGASPIVNVQLLLDRRVTELPLAACVDSPIQFVFDRTSSSGATSGQCLAISLSAATAYIGRRSADLASYFMEAIADVFPAARNARLLDAVVTRERAATFLPRPGSHALRPASTTRTPGLFLAGAACDTGWPATMEGAVRSGRDSAARALCFLGRGRREQRPLEEAVT